MEQPEGRYAKPKFVTFALPVQELSETWQCRENLKRDLDKRLPIARKTLAREAGVRGGVYVIEITSRRVLADGRGSLGTWMWKHHPHVHMVAVMPVFDLEKFKEVCECLLADGLGRLNVEAFDDDEDDESLKRLTWYVAKYLNKDGGRLRSFGILREKRG